jgi:EAL domain-containing protein (putative c-di-GMP-specific phosphodiesterase class I)
MAVISSSATRPRRRAEDEIRTILRSNGVRACFQPLVDLDDGGTIGFEALARGPSGSALERPDRLFAAARSAGLLAELDWACQSAALTAALDGDIEDTCSLFINVEPDVAARTRPPRLERLLNAAQARFPVFVEVTERALASDPAALLSAVEHLRSLGIGIALDDVGVDPRSLALMPFLAPDVIKLDLSLVQGRASESVARVVHAVNAEAERTGALVLAEGVESDAHRAKALALGARFGQGWMFGRPKALPSDRRAMTPRSAARPQIRRHSPQPRVSPYELVTRARSPLRGDKRLLLALSLQLEAQVSALGDAAVVLSCFQDATFLTPTSKVRYSRLARQAALVGALGVGLPREPIPGVRGVALDLADPLRGEWTVTVIAPHFAAAFVARDLGDEVADMDRRFDFVLTYDRELATAAARALMHRLAAL